MQWPLLSRRCTTPSLFYYMCGCLSVLACLPPFGIATLLRALSLSMLWFITFSCICGWSVLWCFLCLHVFCLPYLHLTLPWCFLVFSCVLPAISSLNSALVFSWVFLCSACNIFTHLCLAYLIMTCKKKCLPLTLVVCFVLCIVGFLDSSHGKSGCTDVTVL